MLQHTRNKTQEPFFPDLRFVLWGNTCTKELSWALMGSWWMTRRRRTVKSCRETNHWLSGLRPLDNATIVRSAPGARCCWAPTHRDLSIPSPNISWASRGTPGAFQWQIHLGWLTARSPWSRNTSRRKRRLLQGACSHLAILSQGSPTQHF